MAAVASSSLLMWSDRTHGNSLGREPKDDGINSYATHQILNYYILVSTCYYTYYPVKKIEEIQKGLVLFFSLASSQTTSLNPT